MQDTLDNQIIMIKQYLTTAKLELLKMLEEKARLEEQIIAHRVAINTMEQIKKLSEDVPRGTE